MEKMLSVYGFSREWVEWVMDLVTTTLFSILLNVSMTKPLKPSRGITQGDPMSHFLFILMAEGVSKLIQTHAIGGEIRGLSLHEGMEKQTHQQFMDDTILMEHTSFQESCAFKKSLTLFAKSYGLAINAKKYQVFFLNMAPIIQRNIVKILGFYGGSFPFKYLGVPLGLGAIKSASWQDLMDRLKGRLSSWIIQPLNLPCRLVLVKEVLQAMLVYLFFCLLQNLS